MAPLVTVVMPVFNMEKYLGEAVESVLNQTFQDFEALIIDDCSTDGSLRIARRYEQQDERVRVIVFPENQGVAAVRNRGIREARGKYIALLDSDDVWMPRKLELQMKEIHRTGAQIGYCSYDFTDVEGNVIIKPFIVPRKTDFNHMLSSSVISCSTAVLDTELIREHPFQGNHYHEDYLLWMELFSVPGVKAAGCPEVLAHYRQVPGSRSNDKGNSAFYRWRIYREALHIGLFRSIWSFGLYAMKGIRKYYF